MSEHVVKLIDHYCSVWNEPDSNHRAELLGMIWSANSTYTDPGVHTTGAEELLSHIAKVRAKRPGARIVRTSSIDVHHHLARFAWQVEEANGITLPEGLDIAFISLDGKRIERIIGFFGPLDPH